MELTWHGHSTWHVQVDETSILIDPFFDHEMASADASDLEMPEYVLLTHGHGDHITDVGSFTGATIVGTPEVVSFIADEHDVDDTIGFNIGGTVELGDAYVTMHRADHSNGLITTYEHGSGGMPAGYVISDTRPTQVSDDESTAFYHAGDTGLMTEMREVIGPYLEPDAAALPIGDRFTMGPWQAAIAVDWLNVDHAFPMHYDTFPPIEQNPQDFTREVTAAGSDAAVHVLDPGETFEL